MNAGRLAVYVWKRYTVGMGCGFPAGGAEGVPDGVAVGAGRKGVQTEEMSRA